MILTEIGLTSDQRPTPSEIRVRQFAELTGEFIAVLDQLDAIRLPAYRLALVDELQRICREARQLHEEEVVVAHQG